MGITPSMLLVISPASCGWIQTKLTNPQVTAITKKQRKYCWHNYEKDTGQITNNGISNTKFFSFHACNSHSIIIVISDNIDTHSALWTWQVCIVFT